MKQRYLLIFLFLFAVVDFSKAATLNLKFYIEGYYIAWGMMRPVDSLELLPNSPNWDTDTVIVELHNASNPYAVAASFKGVVMTSGDLACTFSNSVIGNSYYIAIKHRNAIETWSAAAVLMSAGRYEL